MASVPSPRRKARIMNTRDGRDAIETMQMEVCERSVYPIILKRVGADGSPVHRRAAGEGERLFWEVDVVLVDDVDLVEPAVDAHGVPEIADMQRMGGQFFG